MYEYMEQHSSVQCSEWKPAALTITYNQYAESDIGLLFPTSGLMSTPHGLLSIKHSFTCSYGDSKVH